MLQLKLKFKKTIVKYSRSTLIYSSYKEDLSVTPLHTLISKHGQLLHFFYMTFFLLKQKREVTNLVIKDLTHSICAWRQLRGYPQGGNTTHTNAKTSRKLKLLLQFRLEQFNKLFGDRKRNVYPMLIKAEYTNKLWFRMWHSEWSEAHTFAKKMANLKGKNGVFNPVLLAGHQTNGYTRVGKAAKIGKAKKLVKLFTIGVPVFFSRYIYYQHPPHGFPTKLILRDEVNKKLGKKIKRKKKKC